MDWHRDCKGPERELQFRIGGAAKMPPWNEAMESGGNTVDSIR